MTTVEHVLAAQNDLGESPLWSVEEGALYWVDQLNGTILRYDPASGAQTVVAKIEGILGAIGFRAAGGFVLATQKGFATWSDGVLTLLGDPEADKPESWFNDGKVDRAGRFWAGTMGAQGAANALYRLDPDGTIHTMETGVVVSNGIAWSPDNTTMYYHDTLANKIYAYNFDLTSGGIANRRVLVDTTDEAGIPDGLTVDSDGCLWSVRTVGGYINRYDPDGALIESIKMPVSYTTSCIFGGEALDMLYITSLRTPLYASAEEIAAQPQLGDLFRLKVGARGLPEPKFAG
jgi:sugar lactone lactonase YvrE